MIIAGSIYTRENFVLKIFQICEILNPLKFVPIRYPLGIGQCILLCFFLL